MSLGLAIKNTRKSRNLSVEELARQIGKNKATIYRYENESIENIPSNTLKKIALALDTTPEKLLNWSEAHRETQENLNKFIIDNKYLFNKIYQRSLHNPSIIELISVASKLTDNGVTEGLQYLLYLYDKKEFKP